GAARHPASGTSCCGLALRRHGYVAVEGGAVLDGEAPDLDVAVQPAGAGEGQATLGGHVAGHLAANADVGALDGRLDAGRRVDRDVAAGLQVALDVARHLEVALDLEASLQHV